MGGLFNKPIPRTYIPLFGRTFVYKKLDIIEHLVDLPSYPIYLFCQICGKQRFQEHEIKLLSSPNLNAFILNNKYPHFKTVAQSICYHCSIGKKHYGYNVIALLSNNKFK